MAAAVVKPESTVRPCPSLLTMFDVLLRYRPRSPRPGVIILGAATGPMHVQCRAVEPRMRAPTGTNGRGPPSPVAQGRARAARALHAQRGPIPNRPARGAGRALHPRSADGRSLAPRTDGAGGRAVHRPPGRQLGACATGSRAAWARSRRGSPPPCCSPRPRCINTCSCDLRWMGRTATCTFQPVCFLPLL